MSSPRSNDDGAAFEPAISKASRLGFRAWPARDGAASGPAACGPVDPVPVPPGSDPEAGASTRPAGSWQAENRLDTLLALSIAMARVQLVAKEAAVESADVAARLVATRASAAHAVEIAALREASARCTSLLTRAALATRRWTATADPVCCIDVGSRAIDGVAQLVAAMVALGRATSDRQDLTLWHRRRLWFELQLAVARHELTEGDRECDLPFYGPPRG